MSILPDGPRQNSAPQNNLTEDRPAAVLQVKFYRVPDTPHLARLSWELLTPDAEFHQRRTVAKQFLAIAYDLNLNILAALDADYMTALRERREGGTK